MMILEVICVPYNKNRFFVHRKDEHNRCFNTHCMMGHNKQWTVIDHVKDPFLKKRNAIQLIKEIVPNCRKIIIYTKRHNRKKTFYIDEKDLKEFNTIKSIFQM